MFAKPSLAPSVVSRLLPEYVHYWNQAATSGAANAPGIHEVSWNPEIRNLPQRTTGASDPLEVGNLLDFTVGNCTIRAYIPEGSAPCRGWPIMIFFHGGGWTFGDITSENTIASHFCKRANIVVVAVNYRLAPENPFPAAVLDSEAVLDWVLENGASKLNGNSARLALGGVSSGGNLTAVTAHLAASRQPPIPITFQYMNVPSVDFTASQTISANSETYLYPSWIENAETPSLTPEKAFWFRNNYLPTSSPTHQQDLYDWRASPLRAPDELFASALQPRTTFIAVCEIDILRDEGIAYAEKLRKFGCVVDVKVYKGAPHPIITMDKVLKIGRECIDDAVDAAIRAFALWIV